LSLEETIHLALANSPVLRDLGGTLLRSPDILRSRFDPGVVETDPRDGIEAALSAFDAAFTTNVNYENNDRALNNVFFGGGTRLLKQNFGTWQTQLSKTAATGSQFAIKNYTQYDRNNAPGNQFPSAWTTWYDVEAKHPLLQGGGTEFNRLAGPGAQPGAIAGVVLVVSGVDSRDVRGRRTGMAQASTCDQGGHRAEPKCPCQASHRLYFPEQLLTARRAQFFSFQIGSSQKPQKRNFW